MASRTSSPEDPQTKFMNSLSRSISELIKGCTGTQVSVPASTSGFTHSTAVASAQQRGESSQNFGSQGEIEAVTVCSVLGSLGLEELKTIFEREKISFDIFIQMTNDDLIEIGVTQFGFRKKILNHLKEITAPKDDEVLPKSSLNRRWTVHCSGITKGLTKKLIRNLFFSYGEIQQIRVFGSKGYSLIRFADEKAALNAIRALNGSSVANQVISCSLARESNSCDLSNQQTSSCNSACIHTQQDQCLGLIGPAYGRLKQRHTREGTKRKTPISPQTSDKKRKMNQTFPLMIPQSFIARENQQITIHNSKMILLRNIEDILHEKKPENGLGINFMVRQMKKRNLTGKETSVSDIREIIYVGISFGLLIRVYKNQDKN